MIQLTCPIPRLLIRPLPLRLEFRPLLRRKLVIAKFSSLRIGVHTKRPAEAIDPPLLDACNDEAHPKIRIHHEVLVNLHTANALEKFLGKADRPPVNKAKTAKNHAQQTEYACGVTKYHPLNGRVSHSLSFANQKSLYPTTASTAEI